MFGNIVAREQSKYANMATPILLLKTTTKIYFGKTNLGATGLKLGMCTQFDSGSNLGLSHQAFPLLCKAKNATNCILTNLDLGS